MAVRLPEEALNLLRQAASDETRMRWAVGDVAAELVDELNVHHLKSEIRQAIADECGLTRYTIRDRERLSRIVTPELRLTYESLTWHQLRACVNKGETWREYADRAVASADQYGGRSAPVRVIYSWDSPEPEPIWSRQLRKVCDLHYALAEGQETPPLLRDLSDVLYQFLPRTALTNSNSGGPDLT